MSSVTGPFRRLLLVPATLMLVVTASGLFAAVKEAPTVTSSIIVVFKSAILPADASQRIQQAGGTVVRALDQVGIVVAVPTSTNAATLIQNLLNDSTVLDADYDRIVDLIAPTQVATESYPVIPDDHFPHPFPFPPEPADWFYTDTAQMWSVKRVGAQGGGIPGGSGGAWDTTFGAGVKIAILDTGISSEHPDVSGTVNGNPKVVFVKSEVNQAQFPSACDDGSPEDQVGHGTWTSSLAAGNIGGGLVIGVAPAAQILNIKVLERVPSSTPPPKPFADNPLNRCLFGGGSGLFSWTLEGMLDAAANGADVISMSLGGFFPRTAQGQTRLWSSFNRVANFVNSRGTIIFAAAGNAGLDLGRIQSFVELPAEASSIIAVMATTNPDCVENLNPNAACAKGPDGLAFYSDFGSKLHGLSAPGGSLPAFGAPFPTGFVRGACSPGKPGTVDGLPGTGTSFGCFNFFDSKGNPQTHRWYVQAIGTSAATPIAAGVAALVKSANPGLSPAQIRTILQQTAQDLGKNGYDPLFNFGLVDATTAVAAH